MAVAEQARRQGQPRAPKLALILMLALLLPTITPGCVEEQNLLILATTTSTYDSGLLDYLLPYFEQRHEASVRVLAVGTGQALEQGRRGDVDALLVHARTDELRFVAEGFGLDRRDVMYNRFLLVGPDEDPAGVSQASNVTAAFTAIFNSSAPFVSRADDSGTHKKEMEIWAVAGFDYQQRIAVGENEDWYFQTGQSMGASLTIADEMDAYLLVDEATYYARQKEAGLRLTPLVEDEPLLFNQYGVLVVNTTARGTATRELAATFVEWITSIEGQGLINSYFKGGRQLFRANYGAPADPYP